MSTNSGFQHFSMGEGDEGVGDGKSKRWKGETGRSYRFSFLWFQGLENGVLDYGTAEKPTNPNFIGAPISYIPGAGFVVNNGPEITKLAGGDAPKTKVATIVAVWPLKKDGSIDVEGIYAGNAEVNAFVFSGEKYKTLVLNNREFPFADHDLTVKCEDAQYQKLAFTPCKESLFRKLLAGGEKGQAVTAPIIAEAQNLMKNIQNELGRVMTVEQIRAKLTGTGAPATGGIGNLGAAAGPAVTTANVDSLVNGLLD